MELVCPGTMTTPIRRLLTFGCCRFRPNASLFCCRVCRLEGSSPKTKSGRRMRRMAESQRTSLRFCHSAHSATAFACYNELTYGNPRRRRSPRTWLHPRGDSNSEAVRKGSGVHARPLLRDEGARSDVRAATHLEYAAGIDAHRRDRRTRA